jgi:hypothetical protein
MKTLILEASGHIRFSWKSEHAISHFLQPLHLDKSLAIQIGSFFVGNFWHPSKHCRFSLGFLPFKDGACCANILSVTLQIQLGKKAYRLEM